VIGVLILVVAGINFVTLMTARAARPRDRGRCPQGAGAQRRDLVIPVHGEA